jgi:sortase B
MGTAKRIGARAVRLADGLVNMAVLVLVLLLLATGCYALWDAQQVHLAARAEQYEKYKPTAENGGKSFEELQAINPEVFAWLTVYDTHIDYPVAHSPDENMKYINTSAEGTYSLTGAIFLDSGNSADFSDFTSVIYGHHMEKNAMFGEIGNFARKSYFDAHPYGNLYYGGRDYGIEFFAFLHADAYNSTVFRTKVTGEKEQEAHLATLLNMAAHTRDIPVTANDRLVLLSTCSSSTTNGRDILIGRITGTVYADPSKTETAGMAKVRPMVERVVGLWARIPLWAKVLAATLPPLLILLVIALICTKKKKKKRARGKSADTQIPDER